MQKVHSAAFLKWWEKYLERVTDQRLPEEDISPRLKKIAGSLPLPDGFDDKQALDEYYSKKYKL